jgi:HPt (histidine-containing phosphotransfer) domain-containing protein
LQQSRQSVLRHSVEIATFSSFSEADGGPLLDIDGAVDRLGGSVAAFRDVTAAFLDQLPDAAAALAATREMPERLALVHELGSSLGTVGAERAHRVARAIETRWRRGDVGDAAHCTALLERLLESSAAALAAAMRASR